MNIAAMLEIQLQQRKLLISIADYSIIQIENKYSKL